jgi:hypothetical protein
LKETLSNVSSSVTERPRMKPVKSSARMGNFPRRASMSVSDSWDFFFSLGWCGKATRDRGNSSRISCPSRSPVFRQIPYTGIFNRTLQAVSGGFYIHMNSFNIAINTYIYVYIYICNVDL